MLHCVSVANLLVNLYSSFSTQQQSFVLRASIISGRHFTEHLHTKRARERNWSIPGCIRARTKHRKSTVTSLNVIHVSKLSVVADERERFLPRRSHSERIMRRNYRSGPFPRMLTRYIYAGRTSPSFVSFRYSGVFPVDFIPTPRSRLLLLGP